MTFNLFEVVLISWLCFFLGMLQRWWYKEKECSALRKALASSTIMLDKTAVLLDESNNLILKLLGSKANASN